MDRPPVNFTAVHGTMGRNAPWVKVTSPLMKLFDSYNVRPLHSNDPFCWSGDVDGWQFWRRLGIGTGGGDRGDWEVGGNALRWYLDGDRFEDRGLLVHSHGLWPAIEACAQGLTIPWLISVGSPVREDMTSRIQLAIPRIGAWLHIYDPRFDWWGMWGSFGDGKFNWNRAQRYAGPPYDPGQVTLYMKIRPRAGGNDPIGGIGHTGVLEDEKAFHYWMERGWFDFMLPSTAPTQAA
jgi:hypothetical protein